MYLSSSGLEVRLFLNSCTFLIRWYLDLSLAESTLSREKPQMKPRTNLPSADL